MEIRNIYFNSHIFKKICEFLNISDFHIHYFIFVLEGVGPPEVKQDSRCNL